MIPGGVNPMLLSAGGSGYQTQRSLRFRKAATANLSRLTGWPAIDNSPRTFSFWMKRGELGVEQIITAAYDGGAPAAARIWFNSADQLCVDYGNGGAYTVASNARFRDPTAWYHFVVSMNSPHATASERVKLYANGQQLTDLGSVSYPPQNTNSLFYVNSQAYISSRGGASPIDGGLADFIYVYGQQLTPSSFGQTDPNGNWQWKDYAGTFGAQGFRLKFDDPTSLTTLCSDSSGNGKNWTASNISLTAGATYDSMLDVPLGGGGNERGNYATLNPITQNSPGGIKDGNLHISVASANKYAISTIPMKTGKWVAEMTVANAGTESSFGIANGPAGAGTQYVGADANSWGYHLTGDKYTGGVGATYGAAYTSGDVIRLEFNADNGQMTFFKNGVSQGVAYTLPTGVDYYFAMYGRASTFANAVSINFGQRPWAGTPTAGFLALHTGNLTSDTVVVSGSFTGNAIADGPAIWMNGAPETLTINGNAVTWGTHADKTAGGFKLRTSSASYNSSGTNTWTATVLTPSSNSAFRKQLAKTN